ncbi:unnamed protein product [Orchesella dallaii]|uniref:Uncharacterized protein n=1 Tax=Orchesella dallaii TaxID=48710 RepID=A0ABP1SAV5_9HEXA
MFENCRLELLPNMETTATTTNAGEWEMEKPVTPPPVQLPSSPFWVCDQTQIVPVHRHQNGGGGDVVASAPLEEGRGRDHQVTLGEDSFYCAEQFRSVAGFNVTLFGWPCCLNLLVGPLQRSRGLSVPSETIITGNSLRSECFFSTSGNQSQKMRFKQGNAGLFTLSYKPRIWRSPSSLGRFASVYIPERDERIGLINMKQVVADGAVIIDRVNHLKFTMTRNSTDSLLRMKIMDEDGSVVAIANGALNINPQFNDVSHKHFQISFCDEIVEASPLTKALLLSGVIMAAIEWEEDLTRHILKGGIFVILMLLMILFWVTVVLF